MIVNVRTYGKFLDSSPANITPYTLIPESRKKTWPGYIAVDGSSGTCIIPYLTYLVSGLTPYSHMNLNFNACATATDCGSSKTVTVAPVEPDVEIGRQELRSIPLAVLSSSGTPKCFLCNDRIILRC